MINSGPRVSTNNGLCQARTRPELEPIPKFHPKMSPQPNSRPGRRLWCAGGGVRVCQGEPQICAQASKAADWVVFRVKGSRYSALLRTGGGDKSSSLNIRFPRNRHPLNQNDRQKTALTSHSRNFSICHRSPELCHT